VRKAIFVLVMLILVLLPSLGHSQEPQGNNTLPEYNLWLPVVRMAGCPWQVEEMGYDSYMHPTGYVFSVTVHSSDLPEFSSEEIWLVDGDVIVATNAELTENVRHYKLGYSQYRGHVGARIELISEFRYYWKARFICNSVPGEWSRIEMFNVQD
jgi:hypothetical protein